MTDGQTKKKLAEMRQRSTGTVAIADAICDVAKKHVVMLQYIHVYVELAPTTTTRSGVCFDDISIGGINAFVGLTCRPYSRLHVPVDLSKIYFLV